MGTHIMNAPVFIALSDAKMVSLINGAERRVAVAMPAVRQKTAGALLNAVARLGPNSVGVVIDCDENVFRLGYGELNAVKQLRGRLRGSAMRGASRRRACL